MIKTMFIIWLFFFIAINKSCPLRPRFKNLFIKNKNPIITSQNEPLLTVNISINPCNDNVTHIAIYSGMMRMMYINIINPSEMMLNVQDSLYTDLDTHSISTLDIFSFIITSLLKLSYNAHKKKEIKYVCENINQYKNKNIDYRERYFNIKRMSTMIFFIIYTLLCRNIHYAE